MCFILDTNDDRSISIENCWRVEIFRNMKIWSSRCQKERESGSGAGGRRWRFLEWFTSLHKGKLCAARWGRKTRFHLEWSHGTKVSYNQQHRSRRFWRGRIDIDILSVLQTGKLAWRGEIGAKSKEISSFHIVINVGPVPTSEKRFLLRCCWTSTLHVLPAKTLKISNYTIEIKYF